MTPWAPKKPCSTPGCGRLCDGGKCDEHRKREQREYDARRAKGEEHKFYVSTLWRKVRALHLSREPLCRECRAAGRISKASVVDHIQPIRSGGKPYDSSNLQSLCASCHSIKSIREGSRYGR
jgi:5-methylcytosine-specific restriction enzyme A